MMPRSPLIEASGCQSRSSRTALEAIPTSGKDGWISCNDGARLTASVLFISVCILSGCDFQRGQSRVPQNLRRTTAMQGATAYQIVSTVPLYNSVAFLLRKLI